MARTVVVEHLTMSNDKHHGQICFYESKKAVISLRVSVRLGQIDFVTYKPYDEKMLIETGEVSRDGSVSFVNIEFPEGWKFWVLDNWTKTNIYITAHDLAMMRRFWYENHKEGVHSAMTDSEYDTLVYSMLHEYKK